MALEGLGNAVSTRQDDAESKAMRRFAVGLSGGEKPD
jgi:hypothetical protein